MNNGGLTADAPRMLHVLAPAKVNLTLEVVGRRADGYHLLESVMQSIDIADIVTVEAAPVDRADAAASGSGIDEAVSSLGTPGPNGMAMPNGEGNLAAKAIALLKKAARAARNSDPHPEDRHGDGAYPPLRVHIDKRIPVAAGLGGGSADAAAALIAANKLWQLNWTPDQLAAVGVEAGADVPFCLRGGTAIARGIGEQLTPVAEVDAARWAGVVLNPGFAVSTEEVYRRYSRGSGTTAAAAASGTGRAQAMVEALRRGRVTEVGRLLYNALEPVTAAMHAEIAALKRRALRAGAVGAVMCGSGPSIFALAEDVEHAAVLAARLADVVPYVGIGRFVAHGARPLRAEMRT